MTGPRGTDQAPVYHVVGRLPIPECAMGLAIKTDVKKLAVAPKVKDRCA